MILAPLGDQALLAYFPDESAAVNFARCLRAAAPAWLVDVVPAYVSVGVFYNPDRVDHATVFEYLQNFVVIPSPEISPGRRHEIPVCYEGEFAPDLDRVAEQTGQPHERIIALHTEQDYTVYAIGFVPGFPYLGYLPEALQGVPRLASPRIRVEPGSVGLTGKQTGIYPLPRPGGWNLIGRTPLTLVDVEDSYFPLQVGDRVCFVAIDTAEFARLQGERLAVNRPE